MGFKYKIDPEGETGRDTICQTLRHLYRRAEVDGRSVDMHDIAKAYDFAKRIVAKAQEHKRARGVSGPLIRDGHPEGED